MAHRHSSHAADDSDAVEMMPLLSAGTTTSPIEVDHFRQARAEKQERIRGLQGQLQKAKVLNNACDDYFLELRAVSFNSIVVGAIVIVLAALQGFGWLVTIVGICIALFALVWLASYYPFPAAFIIFEVVGLLLTIVLVLTTIERWIFEIRLARSVTWLINVLVTAMAIFSVLLIVSSSNLEDIRQSTGVFIMERRAVQQNTQKQ